MDRNTPNLEARDRFKECLRKGAVVTPLLVSCQHCPEKIPSDMVWRCGYCKKANRNSTLFSFLNKCQHCDRFPTSYICPECDEVNFLDRAKDATHPATYWQDAPKPTPQKDPNTQKQQTHESNKRALEQEIEITTLKVKLARIKASGEPRTEPSELEQMEKELTADVERVLLGEIAAENVLTNLRDKYKERSDLLEKAEMRLKRKLEDMALD